MIRTYAQCDYKDCETSVDADTDQAYNALKNQGWLVLYRQMHVPGDVNNYVLLCPVHKKMIKP